MAVDSEKYKVRDDSESATQLQHAKRTLVRVGACDAGRAPADSHPGRGRVHQLALLSGVFDEWLSHAGARSAVGRVSVPF
jgi:hypothetical protein